MSRIHARLRVRASASLGVLFGIFLAFGSTAARADPPIRSAEDAACRLEAKARVFSTPNPRGLEPETIGRQIYFACMSRFTPAAVRPVRMQPRRQRRHRRR